MACSILMGETTGAISYAEGCGTTILGGISIMNHRYLNKLVHTKCNPGTILLRNKIEKNDR